MVHCVDVAKVPVSIHGYRKSGGGAKWTHRELQDPPLIEEVRKVEKGDMGERKC